MAKPDKKPSKTITKSRDDALKPKKTSKTKRKPNDESSKPSLPLQIEDDVPDFPRGGSSSLSRKEEEEVRAEVDAEFDLQQRASNNWKRKNSEKQSSRYGLTDDLGSLFGVGLTGKLPKYANKITLKLGAGLCSARLNHMTTQHQIGRERRKICDLCNTLLQVFNDFEVTWKHSGSYQITDPRPLTY